MEEIKARIEEILKKQAAFEKLVSSLQDDFLEAVLLQFKELVTDPESLDAFFVQFVRDYHVPVIEHLSKDLLSIIESNIAYFQGQTLIDDYIVQKLGDALRESFGFTASGEISQVGYLQDIVQDTSVKRTFGSQLIKLNPDSINKRTAKEIKDFIAGNDEKMGIWESFYSATDSAGSSIFDSYQKADRIAQNVFSDELKLNAALYVGGVISGSRKFCKDRNGKVFLRSEIASWQTLEFSGKPKTGYNPFTDLGGYRCRHHLSWILDTTAMRLDKDLYLNENNQLLRK